MAGIAELDFDPLEIVRYVDGPKVFGLKPSTLKAAIVRGEIAPPIPLSETGRALGWTRQTIVDHHKRMAALAAERAKAAAEQPVKKPARNPPPRRRRLADFRKAKAARTAAE
jgi:hypothetical protein